MVLAASAILARGATAAPPNASASMVWKYAAADSDAATPSAVYSCTLNVQQAHGSTHVGGTINVVAAIHCTIAITRISLQVTLYKVVCTPGCHPIAYGKPGSAVTYAGADIQANSAGPCTTGSYYGVAYGSMLAVGKVPSTGSVEGPGPTTSVVC